MFKRLSLLMFVSVFVIQINAGDLAGAGAGKGDNVVARIHSLADKTIAFQGLLEAAGASEELKNNFAALVRAYKIALESEQTANLALRIDKIRLSSLLDGKAGE